MFRKWEIAREQVWHVYQIFIHILTHNQMWKQKCFPSLFCFWQLKTFWTLIEKFLFPESFRSEMEKIRRKFQLMFTLKSCGVWGPVATKLFSSKHLHHIRKFIYICSFCCTDWSLSYLRATLKGRRSKRIFFVFYV